MWLLFTAQNKNGRVSCKCLQPIQDQKTKQFHIPSKDYAYVEGYLAYTKTSFQSKIF